MVGTERARELWNIGPEVGDDRPGRDLWGDCPHGKGWQEQSLYQGIRDAAEVPGRDKRI